MAAKVFNSVFPGELQRELQKDRTRKRLISDIRPTVAKALRHHDPYYALQGTIDILRNAQITDRAFITHGLPQTKIMNRLAEVLLEYGRIILGINDENYETPGLAVDDHQQDPEDNRPTSYRTQHSRCWNMERIKDADEDFPEPGNVQAARKDLFMLLQGLQDVGLGGVEAQKVLASVLDSLMTEFVEWSYGGVYVAEPDVIPHLKYWIENIFARFIVQTLGVFRLPGPDATAATSIAFADVQKWQEMAITRVGKLRVSELFDIVVSWDSTKSGVDDLKHYTVNPATRTYVTSSFIHTLSYRLLQPGASTTEILQIYISIIRAMRRLDPKGVLLDRVARPVRHHLRTREDTVRIVVNGILADVELDEEGNPINDTSALSELAIELKSRGPSDNENEDLDWNNMDWTPDPIDAAPDYKKSKTSDVVGTLISLFDTKEVFIKELQTALADRLLQKKANFDHEISVLEHLKIRFGDSALQACEVMLRDVLDSRRTDNVIRNDANLVPDARDKGRPASSRKIDHKVPLSNDSNVQLHAKILSRLFWPSQTLEPPDDPDSYDDAASFLIPTPVVSLQESYSQGFESLKQSRKLTWLNNLGHVTVELDLEDRIFQADDVTPVQASIIYAFQEDTKTGDSVTKTVSELSSTLKLPEFFVKAACAFWVTKQILTPTPSAPLGSSYTVLERLPADETPSRASASKTQALVPPPAPVEPPTPVPTRSAIPPAKAALYTQFITSMLTNQGPMPLARIGMMLGIVVPGGWGYGNEELRELLVDLAKEGKVEMGNGGIWKIVKD